MIPNPDAANPITEDSVMTDDFQRWVNQVTQLDIIIGTGSPEGVYGAVIGKEYLDTNGVAGAVKFIKQKSDIAGDRTMGWVAV